MNNYQLLFRRSLDEENEWEAASKWFVRDWENERLIEFRSQIASNSLIVGRYSVLPFYRELEKEAALKGSKLINSYQQHNFIADIENWYHILKDVTPKTWFIWDNLNEGQYVLKGRTNSRKHQWKSHMFCDSLQSLREIAGRLLDDSLIGEQGICVREYIPLRQFDVGINGLPITNEWRFFIFKGKIIANGFYWSNFPEHKPDKLDKKAVDLVEKTVKLVGDNANFYVVDVAETQSGDWIVIELNDGQMSGLSMLEPIEFYGNLLNAIINDV